MRKIVVFTNLTLDGVMQAPARREEDPRGGFQYGGWGAPYAAMESVRTGNRLFDTGPMLMGRWTYEDFYSYWPNQSNNPYTEILNNAQKYVASNTLKEPLPWINSILIKGNVPEEVARLKSEPGKDFLVMGSGKLVQTLMKHNLVDLYVLLIHPLVLGSGRHLFTDGGPSATLQLVDTRTSPKGVVIVTYQPAEPSARNIST